MYRYDGSISCRICTTKLTATSLASSWPTSWPRRSLPWFRSPHCAHCVTVGLPDGLCGAGAAGLAALLALLALILATAVNDPNDGGASEVDVDVEDPDFDTPPTAMSQGDVVFVFGDWIMDEQHGNYFEIHPVKGVAPALLARARPRPR